MGRVHPCQKALKDHQDLSIIIKTCLLLATHAKCKWSASRYLVDVDQWLSNCFISRTHKLTQITMDPHLQRILLSDVLLQKVCETRNQNSQYDLSCVLLMDAIIVRINYSPFLARHPWKPLKDPSGSPDPTIKTTDVRSCVDKNQIWPVRQLWDRRLMCPEIFAVDV